MQTYHKLVRDRIPEIIENDGKKCVCETLSDEDYISLLDQKLNEELGVPFVTWSAEELEQVRADKASKRGRFEKKILLKEVVDK